jgi:Tfp pilus assembly protein PilV
VGKGRTCKKSRPVAGFTLVEVMISGVILTFVIVTTIGVISHASTYLADLRLRARSSQILQQRVEQLRTLNWTQLNAVPTMFTDPSDTNGTFAGSVSAAPYQSYNGTAAVLRVTLNVTWTNRHSLVVSNVVTTLIANGGINKTTL